jgi:hypothetical protein
MTIAELMKELSEYDLNLPVFMDIESKWQTAVKGVDYVHEKDGSAYILIHDYGE